MFKILLRAALLAVAITFGCSAANAGTLVQSGSCAGSGDFGPFGAGFAEVTFSCPITFNRFDGTLGFLTAVQLSVSLSDDVSLTGHNPTAETQTIDPGGWNNTIQADLTAIPGLPDYHALVGSSGSFPPTVLSSGQSSPITSTAFPISFLAPTSFVSPNGFVGSGAFDFLGVTDLRFNFTVSDPSVSYDVFASDDFTVDLTYFYSTVPELKVWMCLILGLGLVGAQMRSAKSIGSQRLVSRIGCWPWAPGGWLTGR